MPDRRHALTPEAPSLIDTSARHRAVAITGSARRLAPMTVDLLLGRHAGPRP